jgi:hypothetical protein
MKINPSLVRHWTKQPDGEAVYSIVVDDSNIVYLYSNININKFNNSEELYWAKAIDDEIYDNDISVDSNGNTFIIGDIFSTRDSNVINSLFSYQDAFLKKSIQMK